MTHNHVKRRMIMANGHIWVESDWINVRASCIVHHENEKLHEWKKKKNEQ